MTAELANILNQPLAIGNTFIEKRLVMAPMAFLGNVAFRELVEQFGGYGLMFSEMCSAKRIPHENRHRSSYFRWRDTELSKLVCQIYGADPAAMALAARRIEAEHFFGVDINFGCSDASVCRQKGGAAALNFPDLAVGIVSAVREAVRIPLFVKYRIGWQDRPGTAVDMARRFEDAGADALTFHPRIAPDRRSRPPKWEYIAKIKQAVTIPVFGNGNVFDQSDCLEMLTTTGCDGVAIGRMAIAKPWLFAEWTEGVRFSPEIYLHSALRLADLLVAHFEEPKALRRFKKFGVYFSASFKFGHALSCAFQKANNMTEAKQLVATFFERPPETVSRPNMNFFS
ncbi:MAG: tRNA-dihydrouridine synthase family protein [Desulfobacterales bacterium]|nr:tRNA-dihydrouridine synthase family protein [Desulfobacterales bacterium]